MRRLHGHVAPLSWNWLDTSASAEGRGHSVRYNDLGHERTGLRKVRIYGVLIAFLGVMMFPFYTMFSSTIRTESETFSSPATLFPREPTVEAYLNV